MNFLNSMLSASWKDVATKVGWAGGDEGWLAKLLDTLTQVLWVVMAIVGAAGAIYAVYVGIKMARSESAEQREENKKRLINIIVSIVVVIVLILVFNVFVPMIIVAVMSDDTLLDPSEPTAIQTVVNTAKVFLHM